MRIVSGSAFCVLNRVLGVFYVEEFWGGGRGGRNIGDLGGADKKIRVLFVYFFFSVFKSYLGGRKEGRR